MAKVKTEYRCSECRSTVPKWVGRCPDCGAWGSMSEAAPVLAVTSRPGTSLAQAGSGAVLPTTPATPLTQIDSTVTALKPTGIGELDRVLGGGIVPGSVVLLAGEPGV
ncbi:MAG: DNA repair protein RadA, partial [Rhodococcus sp.]|nr:DNA repair protein RadA [Rhodococcus sp. (in: high G+C Gram-positive bacteria)]